jgi:hypothetical protein
MLKLMYSLTQESGEEKLQICQQGDDIAILRLLDQENWALLKQRIHQLLHKIDKRFVLSD